MNNRAQPRAPEGSWWDKRDPEREGLAKLEHDDMVVGGAGLGVQVIGHLPQCWFPRVTS